MSKLMCLSNTIFDNRKKQRALLVDAEHAHRQGVDVPLLVRNLLKWLYPRADDRSRELFWSIIFNLAHAIDDSEALLNCTDNPLDTPMLTGPRGRMLKVSNAVKHKIGELAAAGDVFKSGQGVTKGMEILGRRFGGKCKSANKWIDPLAFMYIHLLQRVFKFTELTIPIISLAWDATRLSMMEVLATAIYAPALKIAGWCPPQASSSSILCFFFTRWTSLCEEQ